jgi:hypothetical protein
MKWLTNIIFYFPTRLFLTHFKTNILLIVSWFVLLMMIFGNLLNSYGAFYLFLNPEYLGTTSYFSFLLLGICFGIFFITWNIVSYLLLSYRYPFVASMKWPLAMFTFNNAILPIVFICLYLYKIFQFQLLEMYATKQALFVYFLGMTAGFSLVLLFSALYFMFTNKNIFGYLDKETKQSFKQDKELWLNLSGYGLADRVDFYLTRRFRIRAVRDITHYSEYLLKKVFRQHHFNAFLLIILNLAILISLGFVIDKPIFEIPAAGSIFLLFSVMISVFSLVYYWAEEWGNFVFIFFLVIFNSISGLDMFHYNSEAFGLDYSQKAIYHLDSLENIASEKNMTLDKNGTIEILNNWKNKNTIGKPSNYKPKMLIILSSGGGSRSSAFSMTVAQTADSLTNGQLMKHTFLMSGASGGMIGLAYFRELYLRTQLDICKDLYSTRYQDNVSKDMINKIWGSVVTNDLYYPIQMREINGYTYRLDRGMMMENALNENTEYFLDKPLSSYRHFEKNATIPMTIMAAVNVSDSRKVLFSTQAISYMMKAQSSKNKHLKYEIDAIDFGRFFKNNNPQNLRFSTALRMNASYPFILPSVSLPSIPKMDVVDAGLVDNFGMDISLRFLNVFQEWINKNTSGVVIVQIRDNKKENKINDFEYRKMLSKLFSSFNSIADNINVRQDYDHHYIIDATNDVLKNKLEIIRFEYNPSADEKKASLSLHLTKKELKNIQRNAVNNKNMKAYQRLIEVLK